jgi:lysophospholipase L1-like esterase
MTGIRTDHLKPRHPRAVRMAQSYGWVALKRLRGSLAGTRRPRHAPRSFAQPYAADPCDQPGPRRMVVLGDSLAAGFGDPVPGLALVGWADRVAVALQMHCPHMAYANLAVKGLTTSQIAAGQLAETRALAPDLIILSAGGNDLLARRWDPAAFRSAYTALLADLTQTGAVVFTATWHNLPLAVSMPAALAERYSRRLEEASAIVREVSAALHAVCVDLWRMPDLLDARCYSADGTHPNARGYLRVAKVIAGEVADRTGTAVRHEALYLQEELRTVPAAPPLIAARLWAYLGFGALYREVEA